MHKASGSVIVAAYQFGDVLCVAYLGCCMFYRDVTGFIVALILYRFKVVHLVLCILVGYLSVAAAFFYCMLVRTTLLQGVKTLMVTYCHFHAHPQTAHEGSQYRSWPEAPVLVSDGRQQSTTLAAAGFVEWCDNQEDAKRGIDHRSHDCAAGLSLAK